MSEGRAATPGRVADVAERPRAQGVGAALGSWAGRLARGWLAGAVGTLVAAGVDSALALDRLPAGARAPGLGRLFAGELGVVAPLLAAAAIAGAAGALVLAPSAPLSWRGALAWLRPADPGVRLDRALLVPLSALGALGWTVAAANVTRMLLARVPDGRTAGAAIAAASLASLALACVAAAAAHALLRGALRRGRLASSFAFDPLVTCPAAALLCAGAVAYGIASGTTSGEGGALGILGVLKRAELELKGPGLLLLGGAFALLGARPLRAVPAAIAAVVGFAPLALTVRAASALDEDARVATTIETSAPLGRPALRLLRKLTDRDRDGASRLFGGGDCDDRNPEVNPMASEVPNNGVDEDCSGADLVVASEPALSPAAAASAASATAEAAAKLPPDLNVLLLTIDTLRWDVGYAGYARPTTPALDRLAAASTVFENAYALASYTGKSIGPLMCGKYPSETNRGWSHYNSYPKMDIMVQERARAAGIRTLSVQSHWYFRPFSGLGRGFDVLDMSATPPGGIDPTTDNSVSADRVSDAAIKVLGKAENTARRFFAWVHYFDPHADYMRHPNVPDFGGRQRDRYDHEVRFTDDQVGRLLAFVQAQPWAAKTAILVTSDHGEAFGEHGMIRHGYEVWEELVRVPLVVHVPGQPPKRVKARRSGIDLVPTILDALGVKLDKPSGKLDFVSGTSLLPDVLAAAGTEPAPRDVFVDMPAGPNNDERRAFLHGDLKLTISNGVRYQLFDLAADPGEKNDLSDDKAMLRAARARYEAFRARLREVRVKRPEDE